MSGRDPGDPDDEPAPDPAELDLSVLEIPILTAVLDIPVLTEVLESPVPPPTETSPPPDDPDPHQPL